MKHGFYLSWILPSLLVLSCRDPEKAAAEVPDRAIAVYNEGSVTPEDLDREILKLPPQHRPSSEDDAIGWYEALTQKIVADRILLQEAKLIGADKDPQFLALERQIQRNVYSDHFLASHALADKTVTEEKLRDYYDTHRDQYHRKAKRRVFHLFKRTGPNVSKVELVAELAGVRERILSGESLSELAKQVSDSESRHLGGDLGFIEKGRFSEDFDKIVFSLEKGVPSQPIATADGVHLFLVQNIIEAQIFEIEQIRPFIAAALSAEHRKEHLRTLAASLQEPAGAFVPDAEEIKNLSHTGDAGTLIMRIGDFQLTLGRFQQRLMDKRRLMGGKLPADFTVQLLQEIRNREIIFQHIRAAGLPDLPENAFREKREEELIAFFAKRKMRLSLERDPERLLNHYQNNQMRFCTPLKLHLRRLTAPIGDRPSELMARLEGFSRQLNRGRTTLAEIAQSTNGKIRDLGMRSPTQIAAVDLRALLFATTLQPGAFSPPYRWGDHLILLEAVERAEPKSLPFPVVREQVLNDYLQNYTQKVFEEITRRLLQDARFRFFPDRIAALRPIKDLATR